MTDKYALTKRLQQEGRWEEAEEFKNQVIKQCRAAGMRRPEAQAHAWEELERNYPPLPSLEPAASSPESEPHEATDETSSTGSELRAARGRIVGLDQIPESWGELSASTALRKDLSWVQANRLQVVRESSSGGFVVNLGMASDPAPSRSALSWLETAIRFPSKFADVLTKKMADEDAVWEEEVEQEEQMQIEEIKKILGQFYKKGEKELLADVPGTIQKKVNGVLSEWTRYYELTIPDAAQANLEGHIGRLVHDCAKALARESAGD
jgi:hypothetical protein